MQVGENVTLEDCEDTLHQVVVNAQQLFTCRVSEYAGNRIQDSDSHSDTDINFRSAMKQCRTRRRFVISVTKWMQTRMSSLVISVTGSRTQVVRQQEAVPKDRNCFHFIFPWRIGLLRNLVCLLVGSVRAIVTLAMTRAWRGRIGLLLRLVLGRLRHLLANFVRLVASLATRQAWHALE